MKTPALIVIWFELPGNHSEKGKSSEFSQEIEAFVFFKKLNYYLFEILR